MDWMSRGFPCIVFLVFSISACFAQDTLRVSLKVADSLLVVQNLRLLSAHYDVDRAVAERVQARLLNNPSIATEWNLRNPAAGEWFDVGRRGQKIVAIEKVFQIAGKRGVQIKLADEAIRMTELEYETLVRALRLNLRVAFYRTYYLQRAVSGTAVQLSLLRDLIDVYDEQYRKGNISLQELARLNATYFAVNGRIRELRKELAELQQTLQVLLNDDRFIQPVVDERFERRLSGIRPDDLVEQAISNRPEIRVANSARSQQELRYALARKQAIPDLTAGVVYDQSGSYIDNYTGITVGMEIPIFNRNQGNIRAARIGIKQAEAQAASIAGEVRKEVWTAWRHAQLMEEQYFSTSVHYEEELHLLSERLVSHYSKSNISLLEFSDLFEAYSDYLIQLNELKAELLNSYEELNYAVGDTIIR